MDRYRAVLFDFFGTLTHAVRRGPWHAAVARSLGCDPCEFLQVLDRSFDARARGLLGGPAAALRWVCDQLGADPPPDRLRAAARARVAAVYRDTRLRPDAVPALRAVRSRGLRTGLVSDCSYELPAFLPRLPVAPLLDVRAYSVRIGARKPDPAIYLAACHRLRVAPDECLYLGDGTGQELSGAARLGMTAVRLAAPDLAGHLFYSPDPGFRGPSAATLTAALGLLDHTVPTRAVAGPAAVGMRRGQPAPARPARPA